MRLSFLLLVAVSMGTADGVVTIKTLVFPTQTNTSVAELTPLKPMQLGAFTLCMNVAMEADTPPGRDIILFAYRSVSTDELNVWLEKDGRLSLYLAAADGALFSLPQPGALETHLCVTWDSSSGATSFFLNGRKSLAKIYRKGHVVPSGGKVYLGQDADSQDAFHVSQSFVGEISNVNMWDYVLPGSSIQDLHSGKTVEKGNIFDWERIDLTEAGEVAVLTREL